MGAKGSAARSSSRTSSGSTGRSGGGARSSKGSAGSPNKGAARKGTAKKAASGRSAPPVDAVTADRNGAEAERSGARPEVVGALLVLVAVFLALAVYLSVTGPLGRALDTLLGWMVGLGRFLLPVLVAAIGVLLIRNRRAAHPVRAIVGWGLCSLGILGAAHLVRGPSGVGAIGDYRDAGGVVGGVASEPLRQLAGSIGAVLVLVALIVVGLALATATSPGDMARAVAHSLRRVGHALGRGLREVSTLRSDRPDDGAVSRGPRSPGAPMRTAQPYDFHAEDPDPDPGNDTAPARTGAPRAGSRETGAQAGRRPGQRSGQQSGAWSLPSPKLLERSAAQTVDRAEIADRGNVLQESLAQHGVETTLVGTTVGPTVTRYELELAPGVKVARITSLQRDIAYAMAATDVRILAPIPGRSAIGVEVPNRDRQLVALGDLLAAPEASAAAHPLEVAIGKDIAGRAVFLDLASTPHLLIAGATGAGKSSGLNCIITSLLMRTTPDQVRLILIDPKQVEMGQYQRLPHLLTQPVTDPRKAANALGWAVKEMERRYGLLSAAGVRDITGYNEAVDSGRLAPAPSASGAPSAPTDPGAAALATGAHGAASPAEEPERLSYIVVVVDELNDLMMVAARDVEESITRIAQKARAVGIHLIIATQRPSVNVITGVIKANVPARIAFAVSSLTDSRVILDQPGAEKLVGRGDMLLMLPTSSEIHRIQGSFVSEAEVREVAAHWTAQLPEPVASSSPGPVEAHLAQDAVTSSANALVADDDDEDSAMMRQAMELVVRSQLGSTSMLQRKLKVGFARAGRIMDLLEQRGVVGPSEGSKAREVLMTVEEFELLQQHGQ